MVPTSASICHKGIRYFSDVGKENRQANSDVNGAQKTGVLKNGLIALWKITKWDAKKSQQMFRVEKT